jgi:hypothetical protein
MSGYVNNCQTDIRRRRGKDTYKSLVFEEVEAKFNDYIIFISQDVRDFARDPSKSSKVSIQAAQPGTCGTSLLHDLNIHFLHVHLLIELGWEFGLP